MTIGAVGPSAAGGGLDFGALLFAWNKADLTQFDTGQLYGFRDDLAGVISGSMAPSFNASGYRGLPTIDLTVTSLRGGSMMRVAPASLTLPERYVVLVRVAGISVTSVTVSVGLFGNVYDPGVLDQWRGIVTRRIGGANFSYIGLTTYHSGSTHQVLRSSGVAGFWPVPDTWNTAFENRGGEEQLFFCTRQAGASSNDWLVRMESSGGGNQDVGALSRQDCTSSGDTSPDWDSEDLDNIAIGAMVSSSPASGVVKILDFRVYEAA